MDYKMIESIVIASIENLKSTFHPSLVHWRVGAIRDGRGIPLAYIDARDVMRRLDGMLGAHNWQDKYQETPSGRIICSLGIRVGEEWIWKSDGAGATEFEGEKGAISDAFKRAAVKWGVGQYLYGIKVGWIELKNGKYMPDNFDGSKYLPEWKK